MTLFEKQQKSYAVHACSWRPIGVARRWPKEPCPPKIFRKYSHFVLWEAFFQTE